MSLLAQQAVKLRPTWLQAAPLSVAPGLIVLALAALAHLLLPDLLGPYHATIMASAGINVMLAVSLNLVNGFTGQFSIGHAGFMAVGAYVGGAITYYGSLRFFGTAEAQPGLFSAGSMLFVGACLAGGLAAAAAGYLVGLPSLRLRGDYLAIVTLGFGEIIRVLLTQTADVLVSPEELAAAPWWKVPLSLGGPLGFGGIPWYNNLFWTVLGTGLTLLVCYRIKQSSSGRAMLSVREDEIAAQAMGVNVTQSKVRAFVLSSFLAGVAGALFAHQAGTSLNAGELNFVRSFDILIMVVLGGLGSISGAALAAIGLTILPEWLRAPTSIWLGSSVALALAVGLASLRRDIAGAPKRRALARLAIGGALAIVAAEGVRFLAIGFGVNLADYRMVIYALLLIGAMLLRPQGLFGVLEIWDLARFLRRPAPGSRP